MAWVLTACSTTEKNLATPINTVLMPIMPSPPAALMVIPQRPAPPESGDVRTLLIHAADYGAYVSELENQNNAWRSWATSDIKP